MCSFCCSSDSSPRHIATLIHQLARNHSEALRHSAQSTQTSNNFSKIQESCRHRVGLQDKHRGAWRRQQHHHDYHHHQLWRWPVLPGGCAAVTCEKLARHATGDGAGQPLSWPLASDMFLQWSRLPNRKAEKKPTKRWARFVGQDERLSSVCATSKPICGCRLELLSSRASRPFGHEVGFELEKDGQCLSLYPGACKELGEGEGIDVRVWLRILTVDG